MKFNNILEATSWLEHQPRFKEKVDLYSLKEIFEDLEINLTDIKKIHVAGTNGKGSTSALSLIHI